MPIAGTSASALHEALKRLKQVKRFVAIHPLIANHSDK